MDIIYILLSILLESLAVLFFFIFFKKIWSPGNKLIKKVARELELKLIHTQKNKNVAATGKYKGYNLSISKKIDLTENLWISSSTPMPPLTPRLDLIVELEISTKSLPTIVLTTKFLGGFKFLEVSNSNSLKLFRNKKFDLYVDPKERYYYEKLIDKYSEDLFQALYYSRIIIEKSKIIFDKPYTLSFINPGLNYKSLIKKIDLMVKIAQDLEKFDRIK